MKRSGWALIQYLLLTLIIFNTSSVAAAQPSVNDISKPVITIAVLAYQGKELAIKKWQSHIDYFNQTLPQYHFILVALTYKNNELTTAIKNRDVDFVITNPGHYTEMELQGYITHIATRRLHKSVGILDKFGGTVIALANRNDLNSYQDLKGKRIMIPSTSSLGGWQVHLGEGLKQNIDLRTDAEIVQLKNHRKVVKAILNHEADAGFIRSDLLEEMQEKGEINLEQIKIVNEQITIDYPFHLSTQLYPEWPFALVNGVSNKVAINVLKALLEIKPESIAATSAELYDWTIPADYSVINDLFYRAGLGPYADKEISVFEIIQQYWLELIILSLAVTLIIMLSLIRSIRVNHLLTDEIQQRLDAEHRLRQTASVFEHVNEGIMITDKDATILNVNKAFCLITGYNRNEVLGKNPKLLNSGIQDNEFYKQMWQELKAHGYWKGEIWNRKKSGEFVAELLTISAVYSPERELEHYIGIFFDITKNKAYETKLKHLAHHDSLTNLPNRILLSDRLEHAIASTKRHETMLVVAYLDLDDFKPVNDNYGHEAGDQVLVTVAGRLTRCVRETDTVARLGGDEFVILLDSVTTFEECENTIQRILDAISRPIEINTHTVSLSVSIGISIFPLDDSDPDTLLRHADMAMYQAKQTGKNHYHLYYTQND